MVLKGIRNKTCDLAMFACLNYSLDGDDYEQQATTQGHKVLQVLFTQLLITPPIHSTILQGMQMMHRRLIAAKQAQQPAGFWAPGVTYTC